METLALEVTRALQFFFTSTPYNQVDQILLAGGCALLAGPRRARRQARQVSHRGRQPVRARCRPRRAIQPRQLALDAPSLIVACGLAMRRFDPA